MGCDIHIFTEKLNRSTNTWEQVKESFTDPYKGKEKVDSPFDFRNYSIFAFLADVRNYDHCKPLAEPKGVPEDSCQAIKDSYDFWQGDAHSASHHYVRELLNFDYEENFWNRRITKEIAPNFFDGAAVAEEGEGVIISYKENLGEMFFTHLNELKALGNPNEVRIVFWFDN
jgi:hypothetical protein